MTVTTVWQHWITNDSKQWRDRITVTVSNHSDSTQWIFNCVQLQVSSTAVWPFPHLWCFYFGVSYPCCLIFGVSCSLWCVNFPLVCHCFLWCAAPLVIWCDLLLPLMSLYLWWVILSESLLNWFVLVLLPLVCLHQHSLLGRSRTQCQIPRPPPHLSESKKVALIK